MSLCTMKVNGQKVYMITFNYKKGGFSAAFYAFCGGPAEATETITTIPTLCGGTLQQSGDYVSVKVDIGRLDEAIEILERAGYATIDIDE